MRKVSFLLIVVVILLTACGGGGEAESDAAAPVEAPEEPAVVPEPTAVPEPTVAEPVEASEPAAITSAEDMAGIWEGSVAGEKGYVMYTADGRYLVSLAKDDLETAPRVSGEYWFEDGNIHLRDLENAGHWVVCDTETVGVYEVVVDDSGLVKFQTVDDGCNEGGFTRNYIFANMTQELIQE